MQNIKRSLVVFLFLFTFQKSYLFYQNLSILQTIISQEVDRFGLCIEASCVEKLVLNEKGGQF